MSLTQKRILQIPLFLFIVLLGILPIEWSVLSKLPWSLGSISLLSIVLTYIAHSRSLTKTFVLSIFVGYLSSLSFPFAFGAIIAAQVWSTLCVKLMTFAFPFDTRPYFAILVCLQSIICKIIWRFFMMSEYKGLSIFSFISHNILSTFTLFILAYLSLPFLAVWDDFFENDPKAGSSDLSPRIQGMSR
ncbi:MAG: hypothetical protein WCK43_02535 [bacterium]